MPKGSIRNPGTKKTAKERQYTSAYNAANLDTRSGASRKRMSEAYASLEKSRAKKDLERAVTRSPRGGPGLENPYKALKRRAAARATKKGK